MKNILIIGAGIHGLSIADHLPDDTTNILILEKNTDILMEASGSNHNRAHYGYHYPRSVDTAKECISGLDYYREYIPQTLVNMPDFYYLIAKEGSKVTTQQFKSFCKKLGLSYTLEYPDSNMINFDKVDSSFNVPELCYDMNKVKGYFKKNIDKKNIDINFNFNLIKIEHHSDGGLILESDLGQLINFSPDVIINAAYAASNDIKKVFSVEGMIEYRLQHTEIVVVKCNKSIPPLTIMDGPFVTILPYAGFKDHYLVYDVVNSVINENTGLYMGSGKINKVSNWSEIKARIANYFPFANDLEYVSSLFGSRPISVNTTDDSRSTNIFKHNYRVPFYSVHEGKYISAPLVARDFVNSLIGQGIV